MRKRDLVDLMIGSSREDRQDSDLRDSASAGRRVAWAVVGMVAFFAAMHLFG